MFYSIFTSLVVHLAYHPTECVIYTFDGAIGLEVIWCHSDFLDVQVVPHFLQDVVAELLALI